VTDYNKTIRAMLTDPEGYAANVRQLVAKRRTRNVWWHMKPAERVYCQVRNATGDDWIAFDTAFPSEIGITHAAKRKRIYRLNASPKVQIYTKELIAAFESETRGKYSDLGLRPVYHQLDERIEAHIFVSYVAYCLQATLKNLTRSKASGLTPRQIFDKMKKLYMVDVKIPTTDGREIVMQRYGEPKDDVALVLSQLGLRLPPQPPPKIDGKTIDEARL